jgi:hypothetical protein
MKEAFIGGGDKFIIESREETLKKRWNNQYLGNPADTLSQSFVSEFEEYEVVTEEINGISLSFEKYAFIEGGGYGFGLENINLAHGQEGIHSKNIFVSQDAEYAYPFFDAMKKLAMLESNLEKLWEIAKIVAEPIPKGIKKKGLTTRDILEIKVLKNKLGQWGRKIISK